VNNLDARTLNQLAVDADCDVRTIKSLLRGEAVERFPRSRQRAKLVLIRAGYLPVFPKK